MNTGLKTKDSKKNLFDIQNEYVIKEPNTTNVKTLGEYLFLSRELRALIKLIN